MPLTDLHIIMSPPYSLLNRQASPQANHLPPSPRLSRHLSQADSPVMRRLPLSPLRSPQASRPPSLLCIRRSQQIQVHNHLANPRRTRASLQVSQLSRPHSRPASRPLSLR